MEGAKKSVSVKNVIVPDNFNFRMKSNINGAYGLVCDLVKFYDINHIYCGNDHVPIILTGTYTFDNINVWVHNQEKHGQMDYYFESKEKYQELLKIIEDKKEAQKQKITNPVYRYNKRNGWSLTEQYKIKDAENDIFGYDNYIEQISKDISNHITYNDFLKSLGEVRSINYLLYGPPGTGKTSLIKALASKLGCAVFIVNAGDVSIENIVGLLSPNVKVSTGCPVKLLLFEDFDRFLGFDKVNTVISGILNALDGFDDKGDTVRFFTANNQEEIFKIDALINRMSAKYEFRFPDVNIFRKKLYRFVSWHKDLGANSQEKINEFLDLVVEKKITVRPFVNYVIRYLFEPNFIDKMIENINELN